MTDRPSFDAPFVWAVGIEDTNVGWALAELAGGLDEYELTRHYQHWREDLALAASLGATQARYGFPWYRDAGTAMARKRERTIGRRFSMSSKFTSSLRKTVEDFTRKVGRFGGGVG